MGMFFEWGRVGRGKGLGRKLRRGRGGAEERRKKKQKRNILPWGVPTNGYENRKKGRGEWTIV